MPTTDIGALVRMSREGLDWLMSEASDLLKAPLILVIRSILPDRD